MILPAPHRNLERTRVQQLYFIQYGTGIDLRGEDITKACIRAVRNAIGHNTIPSVPLLTDGDLSRLQVHIRLAVPAARDQIDQEAIRRTLPVGTVTFTIQEGGMATQNGVGEQAYIVNAAVEVAV